MLLVLRRVFGVGRQGFLRCRRRVWNRRDRFGEGRCWKEGIFGLSCLHGKESGEMSAAKGPSMRPRERVERVGGKCKSDNGKYESEMHVEGYANICGAGGKRDEYSVVELKLVSEDEAQVISMMANLTGLPAMA